MWTFIYKENHPVSTRIIECTIHGLGAFLSYTSRKKNYMLYQSISLPFTTGTNLSVSKPKFSRAKKIHPGHITERHV